MKLTPLEITPMCKKCQKNRQEVFQWQQDMWDSFIAAAQNKKDKRYFENCKQISYDRCGPSGRCKYSEQ